MFHDLLERRLFDGARLFDRWYVMVVDGSVKEKCRQGFDEGGKSSTNGARYRYVLQLSVLGPAGTFFPLMHEEMDVHNPETEKEDCELKSFQRLSQRLKKEFPKLPICLVADALYGCQAVVAALPAVRLEIRPDPQGRPPAHHLGRNPPPAPPPPRPTGSAIGSARTARRDSRTFAGSSTSCWASTRPTSFSRARSPTEAATLYAYITNFSKLSPQRVAIVVNRGGRERHLIEDTFNTQKNNGIGLEHVFCAQATASKNYYTMMQVAQILWILTCRGCLQRLYDWARRATEQGLARAVWEGLRAARLPPDLPPLGQIRFSSA